MKYRTDHRKGLASAAVILTAVVIMIMLTGMAGFAPAFAGHAAPENAGTHTNASSKPAWNGYTVVIDAGHQAVGNSRTEAVGPGSRTRKAKVTTGCTGYRTGKRESAVNLAVAKQLRKQLRNEGYLVVMVRTKQNVNLSNQKRAKIANRYPEKSVFIRLHCDSSYNHGIRGFSVLTASRHNRYIRKSVVKKSLRLSKAVRKQYAKRTGFRDNGISWRDDLTATNWSRIPTTLVEMGFLSNASDEKKLVSSRYQQKIARALAAGIDQYFGVK